jgi:CheY-like chemotaxis protein
MQPLPAADQQWCQHSAISHAITKLAFMGTTMSCVMVVDDEDVLVEMVAALIEDLGLQPRVALNGEEALALLSMHAEPPALILSDVMMPRMNGVELARSIKHDPRLQHVPVILMSAAGRPAGTHAADGFIHKPFDMDMLADLIERYVNSEHNQAV